MNITSITHKDGATPSEKEAIAGFLEKHLDEFGDTKNDILKCLDYALGAVPRRDTPLGKGGFVIVAREEEEIKGAVVVNETGMKGYIPENILVYIAVHCDQRGKGLGKKLMQQAIETANGDIALHVEPHNPAKRLYERMGFTNKYLEMRFKK